MLKHQGDAQIEADRSPMPRILRTDHGDCERHRPWPGNSQPQRPKPARLRSGACLRPPRQRRVQNVGILQCDALADARQGSTCSLTKRSRDKPQNAERLPNDFGTDTVTRNHGNTLQLPRLSKRQEPGLIPRIACRPRPLAQCVLVACTRCRGRPQRATQVLGALGSEVR